MKNRVYAIYSRKTEIPAASENEEVQVAMCRKYIEVNFGKKAAEMAIVYEDVCHQMEDVERPQFKKMLQDLKQDDLCGIVVYKLDRVYHDLVGFSGLIDQLQSQDADFVSVCEQFDTTTPKGRIMMYICSVFAELERGKLRTENSRT